MTGRVTYDRKNFHLFHIRLMGHWTVWKTVCIVCFGLNNHKTSNLLNRSWTHVSDSDLNALPSSHQMRETFLGIWQPTLQQSQYLTKHIEVFPLICPPFDSIIS